MKRSRFIILIILYLCLFSACTESTNITNEDHQYVQMIKNGTNSDYKGITYARAFESFFGNPSWVYFKSSDNKDIVEFTGVCIYRKVNVKAKIQFTLNLKSNTFETTHLSFNDVPQDLFTLSDLVDKAFEMAKNTSSYPATPNNKSSPMYYIAFILIVIFFIFIAVSYLFRKKTREKEMDEEYYYSLVKNSHPADYPDIIYDEAFAAFFHQASWSCFKNDEGRYIVTFSGSYTYPSNETFGVKIRFLIEDNYTFTISDLFVDDELKNKMELNTLHEFIFQSYREYYAEA